jgi:hypothetical protein
MFYGTTVLPEAECRCEDKLEIEAKTRSRVQRTRKRHADFRFVFSIAEAGKCKTLK